MFQSLFTTGWRPVCVLELGVCGEMEMLGLLGLAHIQSSPQSHPHTQSLMYIFINTHPYPQPHTVTHTQPHPTVTHTHSYTHTPQLHTHTCKSYPTATHTQLHTQSQCHKTHHRIHVCTITNSHASTVTPPVSLSHTHPHTELGHSGGGKREVSFLMY